MQTYIEDAECDGDNELAEFFRRAQEATRKGGEQGRRRQVTRRLGVERSPQ